MLCKLGQDERLCIHILETGIDCFLIFPPERASCISYSDRYHRYPREGTNTDLIASLACTSYFYYELNRNAYDPEGYTAGSVFLVDLPS
jgi:hypothetical protein